METTLLRKVLAVGKTGCAGTTMREGHKEEGTCNGVGLLELVPRSVLRTAPHGVLGRSRAVGALRPCLDRLPPLQRCVRLSFDIKGDDVLDFSVFKTGIEGFVDGTNERHEYAYSCHRLKTEAGRHSLHTCVCRRVPGSSEAFSHELPSRDGFLHAFSS